MKIYLIRHGESIANRDLVVAGQHDSPLSDTGKAQAHATGERIAAQLSGVQIVSSALSRALETATIIAPYTQQNPSSIITSDLCIERYLGKWELTDKQRYLQILDNDPRSIEADFEPAEDLKNRCLAFIKYLEDLQLPEVIAVSHNGFGKMLRALEKDKNKIEGWFDLPRQENAQVIELMF
ncbi:TPA: histidine phosphatase family protein [Candidatus Saccharibacteria bacterium]|nr:histidine phosphatase family protein [Candidatus Saccharibacteria bacterium]HIO87890.1 histidine phosphatase family protein [Candidatus Saccharibacteria bacterium]